MRAENLGEGGRVSDVGVERSGVRHTSALHPKFPLFAFGVLTCVYLCSVVRVPSFSYHNANMRKGLHLFVLSMVHTHTQQYFLGDK